MSLAIGGPESVTSRFNINFFVLPTSPFVSLKASLKLFSASHLVAWPVIMPRSEQDEFVVESQEPAARRSKFCGFRDFTDLADEWISASRFGYFFHLSGSGHVSMLSLGICTSVAYAY